MKNKRFLFLQLAHSTNPSEISLIDILTHIRTQRYGLIQTVDQLRFVTISTNLLSLSTSNFRFSYVSILAGLEMLSDLEKSERTYLDCDCHLSTDDDADEAVTHPKICKRQNNIMPNSRLSDSFEDINCELMRRIDSNASNYQVSPKTTRRLISLSSDMPS